MITDPWFFAVAIPAVLLLGISKSGFGSGFGALATPLMALTIPVPQAAAIMLPLLLVMDCMGMKALFLQRDVALTRLLMPAGLLGVLLGTISFGLLPTDKVSGIVGALTLLFLAQRMLFPPAVDARPLPRCLGFCLGIASGFTSFVAHAGSPPITAYVVQQRLAPITYAATMATFFAAMNLAKWIPYGWLGLIDMRNLGTSLALLPLAPVGVWMGLRLVPHIKQELFYQLIYAGMFLTGVKLLWDGLR